MTRSTDSTNSLPSNNADALQGHRQVSGLLLPLAALVLAIATGLMSYRFDLGVLRGVALLLCLLLLCLLGVRRSLSVRVQNLKNAQLPPPPIAQEPPAGLPPDQTMPSLKERLLSRARVPDWPGWTVERELLRILPAFVIIVAGVVMLLRPSEVPVSNADIQAVSGLSSASSDLAATPLGSASLILYAGALLAALIVGFCAVLVRYLESSSRDELPDAPGIAQLLRVLAWITGLAGFSLVLTGLGRPIGQLLIERAGLWAALAIAFELLLRGVWVLARGQPPGALPADLGLDLLLTRLLGSSFNLLSSPFIALESTFGIDIESAWALHFLRQALFPVAFGLVGFGWLMSALVVVNSTEQAVQERFGRPVGTVLDPGLHLVLPWPIDRVRRVDATRVRAMPIGYVKAKTSAGMLWTTQHAEEYKLLLGDGRDLVTVNAEMQFRISDPIAWFYHSQNPESALETLASRVLTHETAPRSLDEVLSENVGLFGARVRDEVQHEADDHGLGVEIVAFVFLGLHPPVEVARDYQEVVSAQVTRQTLIIDAQVHRMASMPSAQADAFSILKKAETEGVTRLAQARGDSWAFKALEEEYSVSPNQFRLRRRLETLEAALSQRSYWLIDDRYLRDGGEVWITN